ncbi:MAG TPA: maleylpyruvate isomerase family mycothiol-dependent enzyme [Acidimicrobiales bacterium]|nr:maleylpyruvate isomerase family mycothiol-dependent enzyme [Acidimicrobiales bacterium]
MPPAPETLIDNLAEVWSSLASLGDTLTAAEWAAPTECPGWTVKDQYAHMIGTESALLGEHGPEPVPAPHAKNPMGELNEGWVARWRPHAGPEVLAAFRDVTDRRLAALRAMTPEDWAASIPTPVGPGTYASFMEIRVFDCWVHEQDVRRAVGKPGHLDGPVAELAMARVTGSFGFVVGKRVGPPDGSSVEVALAAPLAHTMAVVMEGGRAQPSAPREGPTVRIRTDGETWLRLGTGRVDASAAEVAYDGDRSLGVAVVEQLTITP